MMYDGVSNYPLLFHESDMSEVAMFCMNASGFLNGFYYRYRCRCLSVMDCSVWSSPIWPINYLPICIVNLSPFLDLRCLITLCPENENRAREQGREE